MASSSEEAAYGMHVHGVTAARWSVRVRVSVSARIRVRLRIRVRCLRVRSF